jgi:hypothetical protein
MDLIKLSQMDLVKVSNIHCAFKLEFSAVEFLWSQKIVKTDAYVMMSEVNSRNMLQR